MEKDQATTPANQPAFQTHNLLLSNTVFFQKIDRPLLASTSHLVIFAHHSQLIRQTLWTSFLCLYPNNAPLVIPSSQQANFIKSISNEEQKRYCVTYNKSINTIQVHCFTQCKETKASELKQIEEILKLAMNKIECYLQLIGLIDQNNSLKKSLKQKYLSLKKNMMKNIIQNHTQSIEKKQNIFSQKIHMNNDQNREQRAQKQIRGLNHFWRRGSEDLSIKQLREGENKNRFGNKFQDLGKQRKKFNGGKLKFLVKQSKQNSQHGINYTKFMQNIVNPQRLSCSQNLSQIKQIVYRIKKLHTLDQIHLTSKSENIFCIPIAKNDKVSISNFQKIDKNQFYELPYFPPQYHINQKNIKYSQLAYSWLIMIYIYESFYGNLPFYYSKIVGKDIIESWKDTQKFSISPNLHKKRGLGAIKEVVSVYTLRGLQIQAKKRVTLSSIYTFLNLIQSYEKQCNQLISCAV